MYMYIFDGSLESFHELIYLFIRRIETPFSIFAIYLWLFFTVPKCELDTSLIEALNISASRQPPYYVSDNMTFVDIQCEEGKGRVKSSFQEFTCMGRLDNNGTLYAEWDHNPLTRHCQEVSTMWWWWCSTATVGPFFHSLVYSPRKWWNDAVRSSFPYR